MIRRKLECPEPLKIAVIGFDRQQTVEAMKRIIIDLEDSEDPIIRFNKARGTMETRSGISYQGIVSDDPRSVIGVAFDQIFIVDDRRWYTIQKRAEMISYIVQRLDENIPENSKVYYLEV